MYVYIYRHKYLYTYIYTLLWSSVRSSFSASGMLASMGGATNTEMLGLAPSSYGESLDSPSGSSLLPPMLGESSRLSANSGTSSVWGHEFPDNSSQCSGARAVSFPMESNSGGGGPASVSSCSIYMYIYMYIYTDCLQTAEPRVSGATTSQTTQASARGPEPSASLWRMAAAARRHRWVLI